MERVTSSHNAAVKLARSLALKKHRAESGLFLAEGSSVLERAERSGWQPHLVFVTDAVSADKAAAWAESHKARCLEVSNTVMSALSPQGNPPDAVAIVHQQLAVPPRQPQPPEVWIALEGIRDPGNLGTIIRTIDAAGATGVILIGTSCDPFSRDCVRATMGSLFDVPIVQLDTEGFQALAKGWPGDVIGTDAGSEADFRRTYRKPALIVMGREREGLSPGLARLCTANVRIPMAGHAESLNVAIAAALMLYEIGRANLT